MSVDDLINHILDLDQGAVMPDTTKKKKRPPRFRFLANDFAQLWKEGETGDDLGPEYPGASAHVLRLDKMDELVVLDDPYGRQLIERFGEDAEPMDPAEA